MMILLFALTAFEPIDGQRQRIADGRRLIFLEAARSLITSSVRIGHRLGDLHGVEQLIERAVVERQRALRLGKAAEIDQPDQIVGPPGQAVAAVDELPKHLLDDRPIA